MGKSFQELDWRQTPLGELMLRRRWDRTFEKDVFEIKLNDEFLMSSLFTVAEEEVARHALAELSGTDFDVAVGGLGLGYTALTVLEDPRVRSLAVIDALGEVIEWHEQGLIPAGTTLTADPRCTLVHGDFFAMVRDPKESPLDQKFDAIIVDIDHSPRHLLHPSNADFYEPEGIARLADLLRPGGVFGLWSNDPPDTEYVAALEQSFTNVKAEIVKFANPLQEREATATVYVATTAK
ncbi:Spermine/spermidine synthase [Actinokineospora alba]|uniref:Spermine/spermidine synthase n=1 Tax=Actinokineospora alba TaxID=504798 RepID=A0A1H0TS56_9PSEU|nr:spermidine synthase [Actinokineospora alba]TDP70688.1 spermine/spermidine synthase [Actinokineospora alba]SDJ13804.1 Spermine/spermidine synthase [Actinokineospora alba]SDP56912.1 Spermine/spermidine synthase [Actinokineospora alba]